MRSLDISALIKSLLAIIWLVVLATAFYQISDQARQESLSQKERLSPPPLSSLSTPMLNVVTLGYRGLYDDFADIWLLQILSDKNVRSYDPVKLLATIKAVTQHGPKIESLYLLSCYVMSFDFKQGEHCLEIISDGIRALPDSWRIPMTQGYVDAFVLHDPSSASLYYQLAASKSGAPRYFGSLAKKLADKAEISDDEEKAAKVEFLHHLGIDNGTGEFHGRELNENGEVSSAGPNAP